MKLRSGEVYKFANDKINEKIQDLIDQLQVLLLEKDPKGYNELIEIIAESINLADRYIIQNNINILCKNNDLSSKEIELSYLSGQLLLLVNGKGDFYQENHISPKMSKYVREQIVMHYENIAPLEIELTGNEL